jgi:hypothetical protein
MGQNRKLFSASGNPANIACIRQNLPWDSCNNYALFRQFKNKLNASNGGIVPHESTCLSFSIEDRCSE